MSTPAVPLAPDATDGIDLVPAPPSAARRWIPLVAAVLVAIGCLIAAGPIYRHGIAAHPFPSYVDGAPAYQVERYSAPWIAGGVALAGLGVILIVLVIAQLVRIRAARSVTAVPVAPRIDEPLAPMPTEAAREY